MGAIATAEAVYFLRYDGVLQADGPLGPFVVKSGVRRFAALWNHALVVQAQVGSRVTVLTVGGAEVLLADDARRLLMAAPGVVLVDEPMQARYPMPRDAFGRDEVLVGRIRQDTSHPRGLVLWLSSDNLRKGAATNAVQIAASLVTRGWL